MICLLIQRLNISPCWSVLPLDSQAHEEVNDSLLNKNLGMVAGGKLLIFGLGDGALQDFWRAVVDPGSYQIARDILEAIAGIVGAQAMADVERRLWQADEQALRAYAQMRFTDSADSVWRTLDGVYEREVDDLWNVSHPSNHAQLRKLLRSDLPSAIVLVARNLHPLRVYALNRFIFHILRKILDSTSFAIAIIQDAEATLASRGSSGPYELANSAAMTIPYRSTAATSLPTLFEKVIIRTGSANNPKPVPRSLEALREDIGRAPQPFVAPV